MNTLSKQLTAKRTDAFMRYERLAGDAVGGEPGLALVPGVAVNSELVWINGVFIDRDQGHYTIDYLTGELSFTSPLEAGDEYLVLYVVVSSMPISDILFVFGRVSGDATAGQTEIDIESYTVQDSELVLVNGAILDKAQGHYSINYTSGMVTVTTPMEAGDEYLVLYSKAAGDLANTMSRFVLVGVGDGVNASFPLPEQGREVEFVFIDRTFLAIRDVDYTRTVVAGFDYIQFLPGREPPEGAEVHVALG